MSHIDAFCINLSIHPRKNPWIFCKKVLKIGSFEKLSFLCQSFFIFSSIFFCFTPIEIRHKLWSRMSVTQSLWLLWFSAKINPSKTLLSLVYPEPVCCKKQQKKVPEWFQTDCIWVQVIPPIIQDQVSLRIFKGSLFHKPVAG